jgi:hypothetical protein
MIGFELPFAESGPVRAILISWLSKHPFATPDDLSANASMFLQLFNKKQCGSVEHHRERQSLRARSAKCRHAERFGLEWVRTKHLPAAELLCPLGELHGSTSGWGQWVSGDGVRDNHTRERLEDRHHDVQGFLVGFFCRHPTCGRHLCFYRDGGSQESKLKQVHGCVFPLICGCRVNFVVRTPSNLRSAGDLGNLMTSIDVPRMPL